MSHVTCQFDKPHGHVIVVVATALLRPVSFLPAGHVLCVQIAPAYTAAWHVCGVEVYDINIEPKVCVDEAGGSIACHVGGPTGQSVLPSRGGREEHVWSGLARQTWIGGRPRHGRADDAMPPPINMTYVGIGGHGG